VPGPMYGAKRDCGNARGKEGTSKDLFTKVPLVRVPNFGRFWNGVGKGFKQCVKVNDRGGMSPSYGRKMKSERW